MYFGIMESQYKLCNCIILECTVYLLVIVLENYFQGFLEYNT
jgi:hypothetical protein